MANILLIIIDVAPVSCDEFPYYVNQAIIKAVMLDSYFAFILKST